MSTTKCPKCGERGEFVECDKDEERWGCPECGEVWFVPTSYFDLGDA